MKSLRTWPDPQGENTEHWWNLESHVAVGWISQRIMFFGCFISEQVLFCYFVGKKWTDLSYHGKFVWKYLVRHSQQVHLLSICIDPSQAANGSIWQNTHVSALLWHARDCPLCPKMNPKISPIEVFRAPQAAQLLAHCTTHGHFELHVPYLWTSQYPFRISDGQNPALHAQTQVPQQQIGWRPISISCAKTRKSSLPKRFKDHHNQFLFGQGQTFPKDIMVGYQLTTKCRHILGVRQHPKLRATQMFLKSALWYQQLVFPLIRPKIVRSSKCPPQKKAAKEAVWCENTLCLTTSDGLQSNSELNLHQLTNHDDILWKFSQLPPVFQPSQWVHAKLSYSMALRSAGKGQCNNWSEFLVLQEKQEWLNFQIFCSPAEKKDPSGSFFFFENSIFCGDFEDIHPHLHFT